MTEIKETVPQPAIETPTPVPQEEQVAQIPQAPEEAPVETPSKDTETASEKVSLDIFNEALGKVSEALEEKSKEEAPTQEEPQPATPTTQPTAPTKVPRDLSDIDEKDRPYFKAMSNEAFARMKELYKEHKQKQEELSKLQEQLKKVSSSVYEHPEAYILSDDYRNAQTAVNNLLQELRYWELQYEKISKGEDWEDVEVQQDGKVKFVPKQADARSSVEVLGYITEAKRLLAENYNKINSLKSAYSNNYNSVVNVIRDAEKKFFPNYENYNELIQSNDAAKVMHTALSELGMTKNPLSTLLVKLYTAFIDQRNKLYSLQQKGQTPVQQPVKPNPPSKTMAGGNTSSLNVVSMDDFKKALGEI